MKKVILVTGASSGIGEATAMKFLSEGHIVYGAARRIDRMKPLRDAGGYAIQMDITDQNEVKLCVDQIIREQGKIDVLVNNAGYALYGPVEQVSIEDARRQFDVNIFGLASITQQILPFMREAGSGTIINLSSVGGKIYTPLGAWYHATKHALEGWSDSLRIELAPFGIDVIIIEPGAIMTEFVDVLYQPMLDRSTDGPYEEMINAVAEASKGTYDPKQASPPSVIAETIARAVRSSRPKTRYAAGKMAKLILFMRGILSDRLFDKLIMSQVSRFRRQK